MFKRSGFLLLLTLGFWGHAQKAIHFPAPTLILEVAEGSGKNGVSVAYSPEHDQYYTVFAGNANFPMVTFTADGERIAQNPGGNDFRGLWWNPKEKSLEGNCYNGKGLVRIGLMDQGVAGAGNRLVFQEVWQPNDQSVGVFDPRKKEILFYFQGKVFACSRKKGEAEGVQVRLDLPVEQTQINPTSMIFTNQKGMEIGLLDVKEEKVYLFDRKSGELAETIKLPGQSVKERVFNFSFANDHLFLFDPDARIWTGYRIF